MQFIFYLDLPLKKKKTGLKIKITGEVDFNMEKKENILSRIFIYGWDHPLAFLGFCSWGGAVPLAVLDGMLGLYIPDWFSVFLFGLGSVFFVLSEKYEKGQ